MSKSKLFARFKTDQSREEEGVWIDFGDGIRVKIRRFSSKASVEIRNRLQKPYAEMLRRGGSLPDSVAEEILNRQIADGVIADWEGIEDDNGQPLSATSENKYKIITALPEFRGEIFSVSLERDNYKAALVEEAEKNSSTS